MGSFSLESLGPVPRIFDPLVDTNLGMDGAGNIKLEGVDYDKIRETLDPIAHYGDPAARLILDLLEVKFFDDLPKPPRAGEFYLNLVAASPVHETPAATKQAISEYTAQAQRSERLLRSIDPDATLAMLDSSIFKIDRILSSNGIAHTNFESDLSITEAVEASQAKSARRHQATQNS